MEEPSWLFTREGREEKENPNSQNLGTSSKLPWPATIIIVLRTPYSVHKAASP